MSSEVHLLKCPNIIHPSLSTQNSNELYLNIHLEQYPGSFTYCPSFRFPNFTLII